MSEKNQRNYKAEAGKNLINYIIDVLYIEDLKKGQSLQTNDIKHFLKYKNPEICPLVHGTLIKGIVKNRKFIPRQTIDFDEEKLKELCDKLIENSPKSSFHDKQEQKFCLNIKSFFPLEVQEQKEFLIRRFISQIPNMVKSFLILNKE